MFVNKPTIIAVLVAFCAGAASSWLFLKAKTGGTGQPPTYILNRNSAAADAAPDVSQQPPGEAAASLGNWNYDRKDWVKAVECYKRAISMGVDDADIRTDLGNALRFSGDPRKALEQYQEAQRKDPRHENSLYNMGTLYAAELHDSANATRTMRDYLTRFPDGENAGVVRDFLEQSGTNARAGN